jgi:excisionase family DNA binding protein
MPTPHPPTRSRTADPAPADARPDAHLARLFGLGTLDIRDAVKEFGLSRSQLYLLMQDGRLPFTRCGKKRLLPRQAVVDLLAAGLVGGPAT